MSVLLGKPSDLGGIPIIKTNPVSPSETNLLGSSS